MIHDLILLAIGFILGVLFVGLLIRLVIIQSLQW